MRIGYCVEGSTDRALLHGLRNRWCKDANLIEGHFRGSTSQSQQREIRNICLELSQKKTDIILFLRDANDEAWKKCLSNYEACCPTEYKHKTIFAVCERNAECWLCADRDWIAKQLASTPEAFNIEDPKNLFETSINIGRDKKETNIQKLIEKAPLKQWRDKSRSFRDFYEKLWRKSKETGCQFENLDETP